MSPVSDPSSSVPRKAPEIWGGVPMRNVHFTGREETLTQLRESLTTADGALVLYALKGMGGVGKTQTVAEYAYRYMDDYDLVWWISGGGTDPLTVRSSLTTLAARLEIGHLGSDAAIAHLFDALRMGRPYERWLLIYDNVDDPDAVQPFLPTGPGHVLITSRDDRWRRGVRTVDLDVFSRAESVAFLTQRVEGLSEAEAARIAEALGDLPLVLEQAAALLVEAGVTAGDILRQMREQRVGELFTGSPPVGYPMSVVAMWGMSVDLLRKNNPDAVQLLSRCAHLSSAPIPLTLFTEGRHVLDDDFGRILDDPGRFRNALRGLSRVSLARLDTVSNTLQIHRLGQAIQREGVGAEAAARHRDDVHLLLSARLPTNTEDPSTWPVYAALLGHVLDSDAKSSEVPAVRRMCAGVANYLLQRGDYAGARDFAEEVLARWTADGGPYDDVGRELVLVVRRRLAAALRQLGDLDRSFELIEETLQRMRETLGDRHDETLNTIGSYAANLRWRGRFAEARALDEESLRLHREVYGTLDPATLMVLNNLAFDVRLAGDYDEALDLDERALRDRLAIYGYSNDPWVLSSRNNVDRDLREVGRYAESLRRQRQVCADYHTVLHEDHHYVLRADKNLAVSMRKAGEYAEARELADALYGRYLKRFGPDHQDVMAAACNLINDYRLAGELERAREIGEQTMQRYRRILGEEHPYVFGCALNLAVVLRLLGKPEQAAELNERTRRELGRISTDHPHALLATVNLASDQAALGEHASAVALGEATHTKLAARRGAEHPDTLACAVNLAADLRASGDATRGNEIGLDAVRRLQATLGAGHPLTAAAVRGERLDCDFEPQPM